MEESLSQPNQGRSIKHRSKPSEGQKKIICSGTQDTAISWLI